MITIVYTPTFIKTYKKLSKELQEEAREKIALFQKNPTLPSLKSHKLKGKLKGYWSFWVNYKYRIIFEYDTKNTVALLEIGDHDIYG